MNPTRQTAPSRAWTPALLRSSLLASALVLAACATPTPPPTAEMAVATAALAHAVSAGAAEFAPADMAKAREKMSRANSALSAKDHDTALGLAQQVQIDAQVAEAKAESAKARKSADAMREADRALSEEMARQKP